MVELGARCCTGMACASQGCFLEPLGPGRSVFKWTNNMLVCLKEQEGEMLGVEVKKNKESDP